MCILCEKTYGMLTNLADHMTNNHSFIHSGEIKKDLKISEEQQGKKIEKRIFSFQGRIAVYFMFYNIYSKYNKHINTRILKAFSATLNWLRYGGHTWGVAKTSTPPVPIGSAGCSKVARPTPVSAIFSFFYLQYNTKIHTKNKLRALVLPNSEFNTY